MFILEVSIN
jgi:hypothetical protein